MRRRRRTDAIGPSFAAKQGERKMGILDGILGQAGANLNIDDLTGRVGFSADQLRTGANAIRGQFAGDGTNDPQ